MAVFDESKVINALHTDKAEIGKKYCFSDDIRNLKNYIEKNIGCFVFSLKGVDSRDMIDFPFVSANGSFRYIYPYEEPKKKVVLFTWEDREQLRGKWIKSKSKNEEYLITGFEEVDRGVYKCLVCIITHDFYVEDSELLEDYTFLDGTPCGKEVEE